MVKNVKFGIKMKEMLPSFQLFELKTPQGLLVKTREAKTSILQKRACRHVQQLNA